MVFGANNSKSPKKTEIPPILSIGSISVLFGILLLAAPNTILSIERRANKIYMTDPTFMQYRVPFGMFLLLSGAFMIYSSIGYF